LTVTVSVLLAAGVAASLSSGDGGATTLKNGNSTEPNILFIVTDDQRPTDTLDVMPYTRRYFKSQGVYFPNAVATDPECCPSRAGIFSGRYNHTNGVQHNESPDGFNQTLTLQHYLQRDGYETGIFGKFLNFWITDGLGDPLYFDKWSIFDAGYSPTTINDQGTIKGLYQYSTNYVKDKAVDFIKQAEGNDARPWFLYVAPFAPHSPSTAESKYLNAAVPPFQSNPASFEADRSDKPPWVQGITVNQTNVLNERIDQLRTLYSADDLVRSVMETVQQEGEDRDTLAFFISDNGWMWGEHGLKGKGKPYLHSIGIPFYVRWPGHAAGGATDSRLVANIDMAPTALDAAGLTPDAPMDGKSLFDANHPRSRILTEFWTDPAVQAPDWASLLTPNYQYIETYASDRTTITFREYYNLQNDPWELTNLLSDGDPLNDPPTYPLSAQLAADQRCAGATCP
jgi:arylsulfatase A-like enzyme